MVVGITKTSSEIFLIYNSSCDTCVDYFLIFFFLFIAVSHSDCACDSWKLFATRPHCQEYIIYVIWYNIFLKYFLFITVSHSDCACDSWKLFATRIVKKCQSAPHISYCILLMMMNWLYSGDDELMMYCWWWWWWWRVLTSLIPCGYYLTPSSCGPFWLNWPREKFSESCPVIPPLSSPPPPWPLPSYGEKHLPGKSLWLVS